MWSLWTGTAGQHLLFPASSSCFSFGPFFRWFLRRWLDLAFRAISGSVCTHWYSLQQINDNHPLLSLRWDAINQSGNFKNKTIMQFWSSSRPPPLPPPPSPPGAGWWWCWCCSAGPSLTETGWCWAWLPPALHTARAPHKQLSEREIFPVKYFIHFLRHCD